MHFKRIFFRKVGKTSNQCGHLCITIGVLLGARDWLLLDSNG